MRLRKWSEGKKGTELIFILNFHGLDLRPYKETHPMTITEILGVLWYLNDVVTIRILLKLLDFNPRNSTPHVTQHSHRLICLYFQQILRKNKNSSNIGVTSANLPRDMIINNTTVADSLFPGWNHLHLLTTKPLKYVVSFIKYCPM